METNGKVCCGCGAPAVSGESGWQEPRCQLHHDVDWIVNNTADKACRFYIPDASLEALRLALPKCQDSRTKVGAIERRIRKMERLAAKDRKERKEGEDMGICDTCGGRMPREKIRSIDCPPVAVGIGICEECYADFEAQHKGRTEQKETKETKS